jgi:hypothetical protein
VGVVDYIKKEMQMSASVIELPKVKLPEYSYYDNSMLDNFRACHRKYYFRNVVFWTSDETNHNLIFGSCWHTAMDVVWLNADKPVGDDDLLAIAMVAFMEEWYSSYPMEQDKPESIFAGEADDQRFPKTPGRAKDMLYHYIKSKRPYIAKYKILGVETPFIVPLPEFSHTFYVGRKDKTYESQGVVKDLDHKTTKTDGDVWVNTFYPNSQMDGYMYAGYLQYGDAYWGIEIDGALCQKGSAKTAREGFPPGIGFKTVPLQYKLALLEDWLWTTTFFIKDIEANMAMLADCKSEDNILKAFRKHTTGCGYYAGCEYRDLCKFYENPLRFEGEVPRGFKVEKWEPFDILDITKKAVDE